MAANATAPKLILDNRVNVSDSFDQLINYSGVNVNVFEINPDGASPYTSQVLYNNIVVPNISSTLVSRNIRHRYDCTISFDRTNANKPIFAGVNDGYLQGAGGTSVAPTISYSSSSVQPVDTVLRAPFPLQSICDSVSLTINSGTNTLNSRQILDPISRKLDKKYLMYQQSECPTQLDNLVKLATDNGLFVGSAALPIANQANWAAVVAATPQITVAVNGVNVSYYPGGTVAPAIGTVLQLVAPVGYTALCAVQFAYVNAAALANLGQIFLYQQVGTVSNQPLSKYENSAGFSRASFLPTSVSLAGNFVSVKYNVVEQVCISPLTLFDNETFLANINTLSLLFNFSNIYDIIYCANPAALTNIQGVGAGITISNAKLLLTYIQCNPEVMTIPRAVSYNYENVVYFAKTQTPLGAAFKTDLFQSDTVRFQCMPSMIYLFLRNSVSARVATQTQTFYQVGQGSSSTASAGLAINIGNRTGLLASASPQTLFRISRSNGYNGNFDEWQNSGGVIMLNPVKDLGIDPSLDTLPLETGSVNFQYSCYFNNSNFAYSNSLPAGTVVPVPELMIVSVYAGIATITTDQCMFSLGSLSGNEINAVLSKAGKSGAMLSSENVEPTIQGKGLFAKGKHILGKMASSNRSPMKM